MRKILIIVLLFLTACGSPARPVDVLLEQHKTYALQDNAGYIEEVYLNNHVCYVLRYTHNKALVSMDCQ